MHTARQGETNTTIVPATATAAAGKEVQTHGGHYGYDISVGYDQAGEMNTDSSTRQMNTIMIRNDLYETIPKAPDLFSLLFIC